MTDPWFPDPATSRAVLIGASRFSATDLPDIPAVRGNLTALRAALTDPAHGTLTAAHCTVLADPTSPAVVGAALATASTQATDLLLVYYAGHGILDDDGLLHFALGDTLPHRAGYTAISLELLKRDLGRARARARVLILDCCFSGQAVEAMGAATGVAAGQLHVAGTYTLTSTTATTPSHAPKGAEHTAFTGALLRAMASPSPLTLDDVYTHVDNEMAGLGLPRPQRRATNTADRIGLVRGPVHIEATPPPKPDLTYELQLTKAQHRVVIDVPATILTIALFAIVLSSSIGIVATVAIISASLGTVAVLIASSGYSERARQLVLTSKAVVSVQRKGKFTYSWTRIDKVELSTIRLHSGKAGTSLGLVLTSLRRPNHMTRLQVPGIPLPPLAVARAVREHAPPGIDIVVDPKKSPTSAE